MSIFTRGNKFFELSNHLGNVLATVSDKKIGVDDGVYNLTTGQQTSPTPDGKIDYYTADVITASDYYPFGMQMPGRQFVASASSYRYGFNGQEKSVDVTQGNYTAEYWEYDSRLGRRWNVDPEDVTNESPYAVNRNNPIIYSDPDGKFPGLGFVVGFITEFVIQTIEIKLKIRTEYNVLDMAISGVATQVGMGVAKQFSRVKTLSKLGKAGIKIAEFASDAAVSYAEQVTKDAINGTKKANISDALFNASASKLLGDFFKNKARVNSQYKKLSKLIREAENSIAASNKPIKARKINALNDATEAAEDYLIEKALIKTVPATNIAGKVKDAIVENLPDAKAESPSTSQTSSTTGSSMPSIKGLNRYVADIQKQYGGQIEEITYSDATKNSVGVNIIWKGGQSSSHTLFDNRYSTHLMPTPPPNK